MRDPTAGLGSGAGKDELSSLPWHGQPQAGQLLPLRLNNLGFIQLCRGSSRPPAPAPERFTASDPQVSVTQLLMNTNDSIIPAQEICGTARLQNSPRTD